MFSRITMSRSHLKGLAGAKTAITNVQADLLKRFPGGGGLRGTWNGNVLTVNGSNVSGTITVTDSLVRVDLKLTGTAMFTKGLVGGEIQKYLESYL